MNRTPPGDSTAGSSQTKSTPKSRPAARTIPQMSFKHHEQQLKLPTRTTASSTPTTFSGSSE